MIGRFLFSFLWRPLLGLFLIMSTWFVSRKVTRTEIKLEAREADIEAREVRNEVDNRIAGERDARQRLRDDWSE